MLHGGRKRHDVGLSRLASIARHGVVVGVLIVFGDDGQRHLLRMEGSDDCAIGLRNAAHTTCPERTRQKSVVTQAGLGIRHVMTVMLRLGIVHLKVN